MIKAYIVDFLYLAAALTLLAGIIGLLPRPVVVRVLPLADLDGTGWFFVRHWGVLVALCGILLFWAACDASARPPVLALVAVEKFCFVGLVFSRRGTTLFRALLPGAIADLVAAFVFTLYLLS